MLELELDNFVLRVAFHAERDGAVFVRANYAVEVEAEHAARREGPSIVELELGGDLRPNGINVGLLAGKREVVYIQQQHHLAPVALPDEEARVGRRWEKADR